MQDGHRVCPCLLCGGEAGQDIDFHSSRAVWIVCRAGCHFQTWNYVGREAEYWLNDRGWSKVPLGALLVMGWEPA